jgi:hypothetical protein
MRQNGGWTKEEMNDRIEEKETKREKGGKREGKSAVKSFKWPP